MDSESDVEARRATSGQIQPGEGDPFDPEDNGPYQVHGLALPEGGLTFGKDEKWTFWPEDVSRGAEGLLAGRNIIDLHPEEPTNDDVIGEITGEKYIEGLGLAWSGEVDSRKRAKQIHRGRLDASPYLYAFDGGDRSNLPEDAPDETRVASEVRNVRDIGIVPDGAIHGSEVGAGPHPQIQNDEATATALSKAFGIDVTDEVKREKNVQNSYMTDTDNGGDNPDIEELRERVSELEDENENLREQTQILREPYVRVLTQNTDLDPEQVNLSAEELAEKFDSEADGSVEADASADGEAGEATALSAAPLTAARGSPPGSDDEGRATALSQGQTETPDESLETLKERRRVMGGRGTDEYREKLDSQIEALEGGN